MSVVVVERRHGRFDPALRRKSKRTGAEQGCWVYIAAEELDRTGHGNGAPPPFYRVWPGERGGVAIQLYRSR